MNEFGLTVAKGSEMCLRNSSRHMLLGPWPLASILNPVSFEVPKEADISPGMMGPSVKMPLLSKECRTKVGNKAFWDIVSIYSDGVQCELCKTMANLSYANPSYLIHTTIKHVHK